MVVNSNHMVVVEFLEKLNFALDAATVFDIGHEIGQDLLNSHGTSLRIRSAEHMTHAAAADGNVFDKIIAYLFHLAAGLLFIYSLVKVRIVMLGRRQIIFLVEKLVLFLGGFSIALLLRSEGLIGFFVFIVLVV